MTRQGLEPAEVIDYADHHSGTMATLARRGSTRTSWASSCSATSRTAGTRAGSARSTTSATTCDAKRRWDTAAGLGRQKIFEVRRVHNDLTFIDTFLTPEFCREHKLFSFGYNADSEALRDREPRVPEDQAAAAVQPDQPRPADHRRARRQLPQPRRAVPGAPATTASSCKLDYARDTLANLHRLWRRPVHIETVLDGATAILSFDGSEHKLQHNKPAAAKK